MNVYVDGSLLDAVGHVAGKEACQKCEVQTGYLYNKKQLNGQSSQINPPPPKKKHEGRAAE